jgi:hypothetical protein
MNEKIMSEFKPYEPEKMYRCELSRDEALMIQKIREVKYGQVIVHKAGGNIVRTETTSSELMKDIRGEKIEIAIETILESKL